MATDPLMDELLKRAVLNSTSVGNGLMRIQQQVHPSIDTSTWQALQRAMAMLPESTQDTMPDVQVVRRNIPEGWQSRQVTNAYIDRSQLRPAINVTNDPGSTYRRASKGDDDALKELAALLVHEKYHVDHEPGEGPAYDAQVNTLRKLGASKSLIQSVLDSKNAILSRK